MKKILANFLGVHEDHIKSYSFKSFHDLQIQDENDYGRSYPVITGEVNPPQWEVIYTEDCFKTYPNGNKIQYESVDIEDVFVWLFEKLSKSILD